MNPYHLRHEAMRIPILYRIQELTQQGKITDATIFEDVWTAVSELDPDGRILQELHASAILRSIPDRSDVFTLLAEMKQFALEHGGREIRSSAGLASGTVFGEGGEVKLEPPPEPFSPPPPETDSTMDRIRQGAAEWNSILTENELDENRKQDEPEAEGTELSSAGASDASDKKDWKDQIEELIDGGPTAIAFEWNPKAGEPTHPNLTREDVARIAQYGESLLMRNPGDDDPVLERLHTVSQAFSAVHRSDVEAAARALEKTLVEGPCYGCGKAGSYRWIDGVRSVYWWCDTCAEEQGISPKATAETPAPAEIPLGCLCGVSVKPCPIHSKEQTDGTTI